MKNVYDVLRQKEAELVQLQKEIEVLRVAARLLADDSDMRTEARPAISAMPRSMPPVIAPPAVKDAPVLDSAPRQFP